jgi:hypothetical protein
MMRDDDFPPPPHVVDAPISANVADKMASVDMTQIKSEYVISAAFDRLGSLAALNAEGVAWACYDWLQIHEAGMPYVQIIEGNARNDARFWAETATPPELECYAMAAMDRLGGLSGGQALFASRQIKRLAGALFRRMSPDEQAAFAKWIGEQMNEC